MERVKLVDVARAAGVHPGTASRALAPDSSGLVSPETVRRVVRAAERLGYVPNTLARGLRMARSFMIGMVVPDITNPLFPPDGARGRAGPEHRRLHPGAHRHRQRRRLRAAPGRPAAGAGHRRVPAGDRPVERRAARRAGRRRRSGRADQPQHRRAPAALRRGGRPYRRLGRRRPPGRARPPPHRPPGRARRTRPPAASAPPPSGRRSAATSCPPDVASCDPARRTARTRARRRPSGCWPRPPSSPRSSPATTSSPSGRCGCWLRPGCAAHATCRWSASTTCRSSTS